MSEKIAEFEQAVALALTLPLSDKVRLVEQVMAKLEQDLQTANPKPRRSLLGVLAQYGTAPSAEEIDEARRELLSSITLVETIYLICLIGLWQRRRCNSMSL